ncbi:GNAT family N-acetyltransferase [Marinifilum sp.]|uniref:GNAT family N-acetyltransferase n=1 Tax=Marinifilum sp. TaxID=2033137 RepID=UPI003BAB99AA
MYSFRIITLEDIKEINYFSEFPGNQASWLSDWYNTFNSRNDNDFGSHKKPYIIAAYQGSKLVAIVPLMKLSRTYFKIFKLQFVEFLGQQWSGMGYDILEIGKLKDSFAKELVRWMKRNISYHFMFFKYLPKTSLLRNRFKFYRYAGALYLKPLAYKSYEDFTLNVYARKFREDLRRTVRRIKKDGYEMSVEQKLLNQESLKLIREISASKTEDGKGNLYESKVKEEFHMKMYENMQSQVIFIKFNGKAVAYGTFIDYNEQRIGIDAAFDRKYRKYGVGIHCIDQVIRSSFRDEKQKLSFGVGMDTYKFQFTNCIEEFYMCFDFKLRPAALLALPYFKYRLLKTNKQVQDLMDKLLPNKPAQVQKSSDDKKNIVLAGEKKLQHSS